MSFSSTRIIDACISKDNKYVAIGELDTSGSIIQSNIKIISIDNAQNDPENAIIYTHNGDKGNLIIDIKYQNDGKLLCMYDKAIEEIKDKNVNNIFNIENESTTFMTINFNNQYVYLNEESKGLFNQKTLVKMINLNSKAETNFELEDLAKEISAKDEILEINLGTEVQFYDTNGWLVKKYVSNKEITNVEFSNELAAIIYKDKIIVIDF